MIQRKGHIIRVGGKEVAHRIVTLSLTYLHDSVILSLFGVGILYSDFIRHILLRVL